ncbi:MAG: imidazole glycerol phosphate synthase subunit HisH [Actinomycetota bacterium]
MIHPRVVVLDHGMGNLRSVAKALEAAGANVTVSERLDGSSSVDALCVPGQGIFGRCVRNIEGAGLEDRLRDWIAKERPYLGICLGMQILFEGSEEDGGARGLGIFKGSALRLPAGVPVPHIGWNQVEDEYFYFDHSYAVVPADESMVTGWCSHGLRFAARIDSGSVTGVQFHPEKSSRGGLKVLTRWLANL